ncbi:hypothetical protein CI610_03696 [invertebrate metagenome]|uniref:Uncharacterized protein n=1 Tax=invertebrate metagenome TaxID=1711999 RepID=A0A2H9T2E0_9ZZZZ
MRFKLKITITPHIDWGCLIIPDQLNYQKTNKNIKKHRMKPSCQAVQTQRGICKQCDVIGMYKLQQCTTMYILHEYTNEQQNGTQH